MTREEAIDELSVIYERLSHPEDCERGCYSFRDGDYLEAIDMAIEALQTDAVKRETTWTINSPITISAVQGEWQKVDEQPYFRKHYHKACCSVCHKQGSEKYNYCPSCGARMKGGAR